jgi:hypothetical protein
MKAADLPGDVRVWSDLLHEGPVPSHTEGDDLYPIRAKFLREMSGGALRRDRLIRRLRKQDEDRDTYTQYRELLLWFDACLYDMCHLMCHLNWLQRQPPSETAISMVCVDDFPGVVDFHGLGQLAPEDFATLLPYRQPVGTERLAFGVLAWQAFRSPDPTAIGPVLETGRRVLPAVAEALQRHLQQFPSTVDGLSLTERGILEELAAGPVAPGQLFRRVNAREARPFMGDTTFFWTVNRLLDATTPAVQTANGEPLPTWKPPRDMTDWRLELTDFGRRLLDGDADWLEANGVDRWLGGCHLTAGSVWRWDPDRRCLTPA